MFKIVPLVQASLKGFIRDWKSIFLLIIFPLILISVVFLSFNPEGIQKIPVGFIGSQKEFEIDNYKDTYFPYLSITKFNELQSCMNELKLYNQYACLELSYKGAIILNVYYDNTREPVIWELVERIKTTIDLMQKQRSKEMISDFLDMFKSKIDKVEEFKVNLINTNSEIDNYISETDNSINELRNAKTELLNTIYLMDRDIADIKTTKLNLKRQKDDFYLYSNSYMNSIDSSSRSITSLKYPETLYLNTMTSNTANLRNQVSSYNNLAENYFADVDNRIEGYEQASTKGKDYAYRIDSGIGKLQDTKQGLMFYRTKLTSAEKDILNIQEDLKVIENLNPESLVNPIITLNTPAYIPIISHKFTAQPSDESESSQVKKIVKGVNLISLQTIFPTMLLLITFFLSLLISTYISLTDINSSARQRIVLIKRIFIPEIVSIYISSLIIMTIPLFCVLLLGNYLFKIQIFENFKLISLLLLLLSSIFIMIGIALAYLIKKESITLLISTFVLVFLIFFSGFLLPIERMAELPGFLAMNFPAKVSLSAFNKIVFYSQGFWQIANDIASLAVWLTALFVLVLIIKKVRDT